MFRAKGAASSPGPPQDGFAVANVGATLKDLFSAEGAMSTSAWGDAPRNRKIKKNGTALKARVSLSIPHVPLIEIDAVPAQ